MLLGWHYMYYYSNAYAMNQYLASKGYVVLSVNYRSGIGYGLNFREALNYGADGGSEFNDVMGAGIYLANRADVDPERIGLLGRILWRIPDRDGSRARIRSVRSRRRLARRARLEPRDRHVYARRYDPENSPNSRDSPSNPRPWRPSDAGARQCC